MKLSSSSLVAFLPVAAIVAPATLCRPAHAQNAEWKTAYFKRGVMGLYKTEWAAGAGGTVRVRIPLTLSGTEARVYVQSSRNADVSFSKMSLAHGTGDSGTITGAAVPVVFGGEGAAEIKGGAPDLVSDAVKVNILPGTWYLQTSFTSPQFNYFYDKDAFFAEAGDKHDAASMPKKGAGSMPGNVYRVDVLTTDTRPTILCFGDSITQGYGSTPNTPTRYPDVLAKLLNRPTLNLGVNGDLIAYAGNHAFRSLLGVKSVILLMGINDICSGKITTSDEYAKIAQRFVSQCRASGQKVYLGTITPATGYKAFDKSEANEPLRKAINEWIRASNVSDGVIDFDKVVADPANPSKLVEAYQSDWIHPSDAGYQRMAEAAADVLRGEK